LILFMLGQFSFHFSFRFLVSRSGVVAVISGIEFGHCMPYLAAQFGRRPPAIT
jgi:hypothetical protein